MAASHLHAWVKENYPSIGTEKWNFISKEINLEDAIKYNTAINKSVELNKKRNIFFKNIDRYKYDDLVQKSIKETNIEKIIKINQRIKGKIKRILG